MNNTDLTQQQMTRLLESARRRRPGGYYYRKEYAEEVKKLLEKLASTPDVEYFYPAGNQALVTVYNKFIMGKLWLLENDDNNRVYKDLVSKVEIQRFNRKDKKGLTFCYKTAGPKNFSFVEALEEHKPEVILPPVTCPAKEEETTPEPQEQEAKEAKQKKKDLLAEERQTQRFLAIKKSIEEFLDKPENNVYEIEGCYLHTHQQEELIVLCMQHEEKLLGYKVIRGHIKIQKKD